MATGALVVAAAAPAAWPTDDRVHADDTAAAITAAHQPQCANVARVDATDGSGGYGTIVICEAWTSNGLNSPVLPWGSFAVTV